MTNQQYDSDFEHIIRLMMAYKKYVCRYFGFYGNHEIKYSVNFKQLITKSWNLELLTGNWLKQTRRRAEKSAMKW